MRLQPLRQVGALFFGECRGLLFYDIVDVLAEPFPFQGFEYL